jgi:hypothetical protein
MHLASEQGLASDCRAEADLDQAPLAALASSRQPQVMA